MHRSYKSNKHGQRGAVALVVALLLLAGVTVVAFFANRTMVFEQKTSANQYRATRAFELADAGIQWAVARLNDPSFLASNSCAAAVGGTDFITRYNATGAAARPGCEINPATGAFACACPAAGNAALANTDWPRFRVQINSVASDAGAFEVVSRGCTNGDPCDPSAVSASADSNAIVRVLVKAVPTFPGGGPRAGLISGSTTVVNGGLNVVNQDVRTNGITINTGSHVDFNSSAIRVVSLPGTPAAASILDNDPTLLQLTNADADGELFFRSFIGMSFADFRSSSRTVVIAGGAANNAANRTCSTSQPNDCGQAVSYWIDRGYTDFWVEPAVNFGNSNLPGTGTLGTAARPILVATPANLDFSGGIDAFGVFYSATATASDDLALGGGNSTIRGSVISRGDFVKNGSGDITIVPDSGLFSSPTPPGKRLVPVPGSWRDKATAY
jgi:hypothetical protein